MFKTKKDAYLFFFTLLLLSCTDQKKHNADLKFYLSIAHPFFAVRGPIGTYHLLMKENHRLIKMGAPMDRTLFDSFQKNKTVLLAIINDGIDSVKPLTEIDDHIRIKNKTLYYLINYRELLKEDSLTTNLFLHHLFAVSDKDLNKQISRLKVIRTQEEELENSLEQFRTQHSLSQQESKVNK